MEGWIVASILICLCGALMILYGNTMLSLERTEITYGQNTIYITVYKLTLDAIIIAYVSLALGVVCIVLGLVTIIGGLKSANK